MRPLPFRQLVYVGIFIATVSLLSSGAGAQNAVTADPGIDYQKHGVKFQIKASIKGARHRLLQRALTTSAGRR
jgi:hypothetical protein